MPAEKELGVVCPIHQCPTQACPADCPNRQTAGREIELNKEKHFSKEEVLGKIEALARADKIELGDLQPEPGKETYDSEGNLSYLSMKVAPERAREKKSGNIWYIYMVKGEHGPMGASSATCIMKADSTIEAPDEVDFAMTVLEYDAEKDEWKF